jgi:hypothetical protein
MSYSKQEMFCLTFKISKKKKVEKAVSDMLEKAPFILSDTKVSQNQNGLAFYFIAP